MLGVTHLVQQLESISLLDTTNIGLHRILEDEAESIEIENQIKLLESIIAKAEGLRKLDPEVNITVDQLIQLIQDELNLIKQW